MVVRSIRFGNDLDIVDGPAPTARTEERQGGAEEEEYPTRCVGDEPNAFKAGTDRLTEQQAGPHRVTSHARHINMDDLFQQ